MQPSDTPESLPEERSTGTGGQSGPHRAPASHPAVLYIEDDPNDARLLQAAWAKVGLRNPLHVVPDDEAAFRYLFREGADANRVEHPFPCLILLDLKLPKVTGVEVLRRIREDPSTRMLHVMILSASSGWLELSAAHTWHVLQETLHIDGFLVKPAAFDQWVGIVQSLQLWLQRATQIH
jgi:CheY-like chemotaxis protein